MDKEELDYTVLKAGFIDDCGRFIPTQFICGCCYSVVSEDADRCYFCNAKLRREQNQVNKNTNNAITVI